MKQKKYLRLSIRALWHIAVMGGLFVGTQPISAQFSPGPLYKGHEELDDISKCTECHVLGHKVQNEKCLNCHDEIAWLLERGRGYHAHSTVRNQPCYNCHSDHHGRNFQIIRFDEKNFDHNLTGYRLEGAHARIDDCRKCHNSQNIRNAELSKDPDTWLGLGTDCLNCHEDEHRGTLGTDCKKCHNLESFKIEDFNHDKTDFPLRGKHAQVDCKQCHKKELLADGTEFWRYADVPHAHCTDCHDDVHRGTISFDCAACHTEQGFKWSIVRRRFNHRKTNYPLEGAHRKVDCKKCHDASNRLTALFAEFRGETIQDCDRCHDDPHEGRFGTQCSECHVVESFYLLKDMSKFDHSVTDFPLKGKHASVDCKQCHTSQHYSDPLPHNHCTDCHEDAHRGEIVDPVTKAVTDCAQCHTEEGFSPSTFDIDQHQTTAFPLEGVHIAVPCVDCHLDQGENRWKFENIGKFCVDCHEDVHQGFLDERFYPNQRCENCHQTESWSDIRAFDHSVTDFPLEGKHREVRCGDCHRADQAEGSVQIQFRDISQQCASCHDDIHYGQFEEDGRTDCQRCHTPQGWKPSTFDHNTARFRLEGKHAELECSACHLPTVRDGHTYILYANGKIHCADCHR